MTQSPSLEDIDAAHREPGELAVGPVDGGIHTLPSLLSRAHLVSTAKRGLEQTSCANGVQQVQPSCDVHCGLHLTCAQRSTLAEKVRHAPVQGTLGKEILELVSFQNCEHLRRGSALATVMQRGCRIFATNAGSKATYALSREVSNIDAFISHNWCIPWYNKYVALAWHFNLVIALCASVAAMVVLATLGGVGILPVVHHASFPYPRGFLCRICGFPVFLGVLFFVRDFGSMIGVRGPTVFLDKTCIHQENMAAKELGIKRLGAFLCYSRKMVVLYTDVYLHKLWTVYEIASFLALHEARRVKFVPVTLSVRLVQAWTVLYVVAVVSIIVEAYPGLVYPAHITALVLAYPLYFVFRRWAREQVAIKWELAHFRVADCACLCEEDRPLVYNNISTLMKATGGVRDNADDDDALSYFNQLVQKSLANALAWVIGPLGLCYADLFTSSFFLVAPYAFDHAVGVGHGVRLRHAVGAILYFGVLCFGLAPLAFALPIFLMKQCLHLRGWQEQAYLLACWQCCGVLTFVPLAVLVKLGEWSRHSDVAVASLACIQLIVFIVVFNITRAKDAPYLDRLIERASDLTSDAEWLDVRQAFKPLCK